MPWNRCDPLVIPLAALSVFLRVTPDCITSNPEIVFSASPLSIVNCIGLIINTTSSLTVAVITLRETSPVSRTDLLCICVMPEPAS